MLRPMLFALLLGTVLQGNVAKADPLLQALFVQGEVLDGASSLPGFIPPDNSNIFDPISGDDVRNNGQGNVRVNVNGNFINDVRTNSDQGSANSAAGAYYFFGSTTRGTSPTALRREATVAGIEQQNLNVGGIDNAGNVSYTALTGNTGTAGSGFSVLWENDTPIFSPGDLIPAGPLGPPPPASGGTGPNEAVGASGFYFGGPAGVARTPDGITSWVTSYRALPDGEAVGSALMRDTTNFDVLLQSGDVIPGLVTVQAMGGAIGGNVEWSALGTNYLTSVAVPNGETGNQGQPLFDSTPIINGQALFTLNGGGLLRPDEPIPAADGGLPGETWSSFNTVWDVNEAGDYIIAAFTNASSAEDDVVIYNGEVLYRQGQTLDGIPLAGQAQGAVVNDLGDIAVIWNDTLFVNGEAIAGAATIKDLGNNDIAGLGTLIDTTGDGVGDTALDDLALSRIEISNLPAAGGDGLPVIYLGGEVGSSLDTTIRLAPAADLAGDYNGDGVVDAADYTVWRDTEGSALLLAADGDQDNTVNSGDYGVWTGNFGGALPSNSAAVPEPSACVLLLAALAGAAPRRS